MNVITRLGNFSGAEEILLEVVDLRYVQQQPSIGHLGSTRLQALGMVEKSMGAVTHTVKARKHKMKQRKCAFSENNHSAKKYLRCNIVLIIYLYRIV